MARAKSIGYAGRQLPAMRPMAWIAAVLALAIAALLLLAPARALADEALDASGAAIGQSAISLGHMGSETISADNDAIVFDGVDFGIESFSRQNKGTNKSYEGNYYGYRWPMPAQDAFSVIVRDDLLIVYIPAATAASLGIDIADAQFQEQFLGMLSLIDAASSRGGQEWAKLGVGQACFTSSPTVAIGDYTYAFAVEVEPGYWYATSTLAGSTDGSGGGLYAESGVLAEASSMSVVPAAEGLAALGEFFEELDWSPLWVSLRTTGVAIIIIFILGLLAAWGTIRVSDKVKGILDTIFTIPMVLPPTVCGFLLLLFFGKSTPIGQWLIDHGIDIVFTWPAAVIACTVVGFPLMYRTARGAFENLDQTMLDAARTLGWSEPRIFTRIMIPLAWPSIASGTVLGFARAMGEFGATLFFAGNYVGITQTIPIAIYFDWMGGNTGAAIFWALVVILISFLVILFINVYSSRTQRYKAKGGAAGEHSD